MTDEGSPEPSIAERREALAWMAQNFGPEPVPVERVEDNIIAAEGREIPVRIYWPEERDPASPVLLQIHGGGWALGGPEVYQRQSRALCGAARSVLVDVDYRLAPENRYPAAIDDCVEAARWALEFAGHCGLPDTRLNVIGDSAGGYLAAVLCQRFPDMFGAQILVYPVLSVGRVNDCPSRRELGGGENFLAFEAIANAEVDFFGSEPGGAEAELLSPLHASDDVLAALPRSLIVLAGADPLVDEGRAYAERLARCGVDVSLRCDAGTIHGSVLFAGAIAAGMDATREIGEFIRRQ